MKTIALSIAISTLLISGCEIMGPSVRVEPPKVRVDGVKVESDDRGSNGKFCPPGQAKKGNC